LAAAVNKRSLCSSSNMIYLPGNFVLNCGHNTNYSLDASL
jgi:hypothetical protein